MAMAYSSRRPLSRSAMSAPSSSTSIDAKEDLTKAKLQSPGRSSDTSNIFVQMNEFSKLESPAKGELSPPIATVASPTRARCSSSTGALSISSLRSVLSLPTSVRHSPSTAKNDSAERLADVRNLASAVDDNKNCISSENAGVDCADETGGIPAKRKKLSELNENDVCDRYKQKYCVDQMSSLRLLHNAYQEDLTELFFLQNGGNLMDYFSWKKRPNTLLACYLRSESIDEDIDGSLFLVSIKVFFVLLGCIAVLHTYIDAACCYRPSSVVCLSVSLSICHTIEPCNNI